MFDDIDAYTWLTTFLIDKVRQYVALLLLQFTL